MGLLRSLLQFAVDFRIYHSAGLLSDAPQGLTTPVLWVSRRLPYFHQSLLGQAIQPALACSHSRRFEVVRVTYPWSTVLDGIPGQVPSYRRSGRLQGLMVSRYPAACASPLHLRGWNYTSTGVKLAISGPIVRGPLSCPVSNRTRVFGVAFSTHCQSEIVGQVRRSRFKAVPASSSGLIHPRRTKLQHGTFLHFGHPRL